VGNGGDKAIAVAGFANNLKNALQESFGAQRDIRLQPVDTSIMSAAELVAHDNAQYALELRVTP